MGGKAEKMSRMYEIKYMMHHAYSLVQVVERVMGQQMESLAKSDDLTKQGGKAKRGLRGSWEGLVASLEGLQRELKRA